jgi:hypothetical protein
LFRSLPKPSVTLPKLSDVLPKVADALPEAPVTLPEPSDALPKLSAACRDILTHCRQSLPQKKPTNRVNSMKNSEKHSLSYFVFSLILNLRQFGKTVRDFHLWNLMFVGFVF